MTSLVEERQEHAEVLIGRYRLTGHFDDPGAQSAAKFRLVPSPGGAREPDPLSVITCRSIFVVEDAVPLD